MDNNNDNRENNGYERICCTNKEAFDKFWGNEIKEGEERNKTDINENKIQKIPQSQCDHLIYCLKSILNDFYQSHSNKDRNEMYAKIPTLYYEHFSKLSSNDVELLKILLDKMDKKQKY